MNGSHQVALWSGIAAFFGCLLAVGIFDLINPAKAWEYLGALIVAFITAGSVYAKQRLDDAKEEKESLRPMTTYEKNKRDANGNT